MPRALKLVRTTWLLSLALSAIPSVALAETLFESKGCVSCHGAQGQGIPGLAPPLKGSAFVTSASTEEVQETIVKGRSGKNRRHPAIPGGMPPNPMPEEDAKQLAQFVKGDLQK